jgi:hypothetical protein
MSKSMTKAQLVDECVRLRAQLDHMERIYAERDERCNAATQRVCELEAQLAGTQELHALTKDALREVTQEQRAVVHAKALTPCATYWDYVRARREQCRAKGKAVSYKTRDQWEAAVAAHIANS